MRNALLTRFAAANPGAIDAEMRAKIIEETCRQNANQCAPRIARWIVDEPVSPVRDHVRRRVVNNQRLARAVRIAMVDQLVPLFDGAPGEPPAKVTPEDAARASNLYMDFYDHSAPFSRKALVDLWQRCEADPKQQQACTAARSKLEAIVGDLRQ